MKKLIIIITRKYKGAEKLSFWHLLKIIGDNNGKSN